MFNSHYRVEPNDFRDNAIKILILCNCAFCLTPPERKCRNNFVDTQVCVNPILDAIGDDTQERDILCVSRNSCDS